MNMDLSVLLGICLLRGPATVGTGKMISRNTMAARSVFTGIPEGFLGDLDPDGEPRSK